MRPADLERILSVMALLDYAGARGRSTLEQAVALGRDWVVQPKIDGCYVHVLLDGAGRIATVLTRNGRSVPATQLGPLHQAYVGSPFAHLVGELEAHTEAGERAARRGWRLIHLHDVVRTDTGRVAHLSYDRRRALLWEMQSRVVNFGRELPWYRDAHGDAHSRATGDYCRAVPQDWRLTPIVPQMAAGRARRAWCEWVDGVGGEGLVAVNLRASATTRRAKLKIKQLDTVEASVIEVLDRQVICRSGIHMYAVGARKSVPVNVGDVVEVAHNGHYETTGHPRFARLVRVRRDLH